MTRRKPIDFFKYTQLDPEDDVVFFGPITKRELLRSVEVEEEVVRRRIAKKKAEEAEKKISEANELREEKTDNDLNRTFEIAAPVNDVENTPEVLKPKKRCSQSIAAQKTLNDVTQLHHNHEEAKLLDLSVQFSRTSMKPPNLTSANHLLDETINLNESRIGVCLPTPLFEKISKSKNVTTRKLADTASKENRDEKMGGTPHLVRLSNTFITEMIKEDVLNATIPDEVEYNSKTVERVGTPDIFKQKRSEFRKNSVIRPLETNQCDATRPVKKNSAVKKSTLFFPKSPATTVASKLPMKTSARGQTLFAKSPSIQRSSSLKTKKDSTTLFAKSPVAAYIREGKEIQSMSKFRHMACAGESNDRRSKSDRKILKNCKIPIPMEGSVKRKLDLEK